MPQPSRTPVSLADDLVLVKSTSLPLPASDCFRLFTVPAGLESWLCEKASVEPRLGGRYELFWEPDDPSNNSTIGCRISVFESDRVLGFQWRSPKQFKSFANAADPLTHVVITFHADQDGTAITLVHSGWRSSPEWQQAAQWQDVAWNFAFQSLQARASGAVRKDA